MYIQLFRRGVSLCYSQFGRVFIFTGYVRLSMCFGNSAFCVANPDVVFGRLRSCTLFPCPSFKVYYWIVCVIYDVMFWFFRAWWWWWGGDCSFRGMFRLLVCVLAACPRTEAFRPWTLALWCFRLGNRIFWHSHSMLTIVPDFVAVYWSVFGIPAPLSSHRSIISGFVTAVEIWFVAAMAHFVFD